MIHQVSSLNHMIVPGRVHEALHVHRKSPLRVFMSHSKRIVLGGCSPVDRLDSFTGRCTRTLCSDLKGPILVYSESACVTITKNSGGSCLGGGVDSLIRGAVRRHDSILIGRSNSVSLMSKGARSSSTCAVNPVVTGNSPVKTIVVFTGRSSLNSIRRGTIRATTNFLTERVRSWG